MPSASSSADSAVPAREEVRPGPSAPESAAEISGGRGVFSPGLRVLFVTAWYPNPDRPVEGVFIREHAKVVGRRDDVVVLHLAGVRSGGPWWDLQEERDPRWTEGVRTYRLWCRRSPIPHTTNLISLWSVWRAGRLLRDVGFVPDVVHAHVYHAAIAAWMLARLWGRPLVITEHSSAFARNSLTRRAALAAKLAFGAARYVLPVSRALQSALEARGVRARFRTVPNVVDPTVFHEGSRSEPNAPQRILFVGIFDAAHVKGIPTLLRALTELRKRRDGWQLRLVGDGPARSEYERLACELRLEGFVHFLGLKAKAEVADEMRKADVLVLPSRWENLPCVLLEAQASGLPVVASAVGGVPEIVLEGTGALVPPGNVEALGNAIEAVLSGRKTIDREAIRRSSERFRPDVVAAQLHSIYESAVGREGRPARRSPPTADVNT